MNTVTVLLWCIQYYLDIKENYIINKWRYIHGKSKIS